MPANQPEDEYMFDASYDVWVCLNCGAVGYTRSEVNHAESCKTGEAKFWEHYYSEEDDGGHDDD